MNLFSFLRPFFGIWRTAGILTIAALVALALVILGLAPYFREEWTLWVALVVMVAGFIVLRRRPRR